MKAAFILLALAFASPAQAGNTCEVELGNKLITNGGKKAKLDVPCKYPAVRQQCGDYFVRATPGNTYVNRYFVDTLWVAVTHKDGKYWEGRTSSKIAAKFINDAGETRDAFNKKDGNIETDDLFDFSKTKNSIVARAKDGSFDIVFGPFDPVGSKHRNAAFVFRCREDDVPPAFPAQICGGEDEKDVQYMAEELGIKPGKKFKPHMRDQTYYYAIFTDPDLDQTPNPKCGEARDTMLNVCPDDAKRKEAIENCYMILYSKPHRQCATKYTCDLMDVFAACIKFVCSDYTDMEACAEVGEAIDMCRSFPGLSDKVADAKCYKDFFIDVKANSEDFGIGKDVPKISTKSKDLEIEMPVPKILPKSKDHGIKKSKDLGIGNYASKFLTWSKGLGIRNHLSGIRNHIYKTKSKVSKFRFHY